MTFNLTLAALIVVAIWIAILAVYLAVSRRQPNLADQMHSVDEQLKAAESSPASE